MSQRGKWWKLSQELISTVSAAGTLLLGVATLWITVKVSGIEDYLRSEIKYRNEELISATQNVRELQFQQKSLQKNIRDKGFELAELQKQIALTRGNLMKTAGEDKASKASLDLRLRAQTYQILHFAGYMNLLRDDDFDQIDAKTIPIGEQYNSSIQHAIKDPENGYLLTYFQKAEQGLHRSCPEIFSTTITVPAGLARPDFPSIKPKSNKIEDMVAARDAASKQFSEKYKASEAASDKRHQTIKTGFDDFYKTEEACLCAVLSSHQEKETVCKEAKFYE